MVTISHIYNNESGLDARVKINSAFDALYSSGASIIEDTYVNIQTLVSSDSLTPGNLYKITNRADNGIILLAVTTNEFSLEGQGIFLNPDFQGVGIYSGVSGYNSTKGVWYEDGENLAIFVNGDVVFWDGLHYKLFDDQSVNLTNPSINTGAYVLLPKSTTNVGYIEEIDFILYKFQNDQIIWQEDKRSNKWNPRNFDLQRGNDSVSYNTILGNCTGTILNQRGSFGGNTLDKECRLTVGNTHEGSIEACVFKAGNGYVANFDLNKGLFECSIELLAIINFDNTKLYEYKEVSLLGSTFEADLDMTTDFAANVLTIPTNLNYVGIFTLINDSALTINKIVNLPLTHKSRFYVEIGSNQIFNHTSISLAIADELVSDDGAATNTIEGRTNGSDFIEYEKAGDLNRKYNSAILIPKYKIYLALVSQSGILAPTATVLENTLGVSTSFTYDGAGQYLLNATGAFASGKVVFYSSQPSSDAQQVTGQMDSNDTYFIGTIDNNFYTDQLLNNTTIEIRVYP